MKSSKILIIGSYKEDKNMHSKLPNFFILFSWILIHLLLPTTIDVITVAAFRPINSKSSSSGITQKISSKLLRSSTPRSNLHLQSRSYTYHQPFRSNTVRVNTAVASNTINSDLDSSKSHVDSTPIIITATVDDIATDEKKKNDERIPETKTVSDKSSNSNNNNDKSNYENDTENDVGVVGDWQNLHDNWVLRPRRSSSSSSSSFNQNDGSTPPRAVIHFLGGALVGCSPHVTYRFILEKLANEGFLIVATPYDLSFDHLATCDAVLTKFEAVAPTLARQYGALPVVGVGHSCGALLQVLISSLFPDTPRAANALLSFNNKPVNEAVPFFEEFFAPVFSSLATTTTTIAQPETDASTDIDTDTGTYASKYVKGPSSNDSLVLGLKLAKAAVQGKLPSDELLDEAQRVVTTGVSSSSLFPFFPKITIPAPQQQQQQTIKIPTEIRDAYSKFSEPTVTLLRDLGFLPIIYETIVTLEQVPQLIEEVADGARDFNPTPAMVRSAAGKAYRARRTLILGYDDDPIDESDEVEEVLREARSITRMRRPMVEIDVQRKTLSGGHASPLLAPPVELAGQAEDLLGVETSQESLGYREAATTVEELVRWLDEGNL